VSPGIQEHAEWNNGLIVRPLITSTLTEGRTAAKFARFPFISLGSEHLVMGYLMRRKILAYRVAPNNEGYDAICIHPDPRRITRQIRSTEKDSPVGC
jgi:hypothetical protein